MPPSPRKRGRSVIYKIPVAGWLLKDAIHGRPDAKYYFIANVLIMLGVLIYTFGYPFLITAAIGATAAYLLFLVAFTAKDTFY